MALHALLTQHELDPLIGERNRQRWQKQNQLTPAFPVNAFGRKLRIFPAFALGQVVARTPRRTQQSPSAIEAITRASQRLYEAAPFRVLTEILRRHLHEIERPDALALSELLLALAPDALLAMQQEMEGIELALREHAVTLDARLGRVRSFDDATVMVELAGGGVRAIRRHRAVGDLLAGAWVLCDRVSVGTLADEFLLPALSPARMADLDWRQAALDELHAQVKATQRDDGSLDADYAFLLWEDSGSDALVRFAREAQDALSSASTPEDWRSFLDRRREAYSALPPFRVQPADDAPSGPLEQIDGYVSDGDWRSAVRGTRNPFATARRR
jgi:hypothetical protein